MSFPFSSNANIKLLVQYQPFTQNSDIQTSIKMAAGVREVEDYKRPPDLFLIGAFST